MTILDKGSNVVYTLPHPLWRVTLETVPFQQDKGRVPKKNQNVNFFLRGGGSTPKFTFLQSEKTVKRGFKMGFFNTRMCYFKFRELKKKF